MSDRSPGPIFAAQPEAFAKEVSLISFINCQEMIRELFSKGGNHSISFDENIEGVTNVQKDRLTCQ